MLCNNSADSFVFCEADFNAGHVSNVGSFSVFNLIN